MSRLVVISNRVADPRRAAAGGLAVAMGDALRQTGGLWFGWSGEAVECEPGAPTLQQRQAITYATIDLPAADQEPYYGGFCNGALWPLFHYFVGALQYSDAQYAAYGRVNRLFADRLHPLLNGDDLVWVHDYHLVPLAGELRALGCQQRIGFFLHIPLPPPMILAAIPGHDWLLRGLCAYDLVGFQSQTDHEHFCRYIEREAMAQDLGEGRWRVFNLSVQAGAFPIGIYVAEFTALTESPEGC